MEKSFLYSILVAGIMFIPGMFLYDLSSLSAGPQSPATRWNYPDRSSGITEQQITDFMVAGPLLTWNFLISVIVDSWNGASTWLASYRMEFTRMNNAICWAITGFLAFWIIRILGGFRSVGVDLPKE